MEWREIVSRKSHSFEVKNKKRRLGIPCFLQKEHGIDGMNNSSFVGMFPLTRKCFTLVGALKEVTVDPLNCSGLFLIKPLHTFSAGHYAGPAVHN